MSSIVFKHEPAVEMFKFAKNSDRFSYFIKLQVWHWIVLEDLEVDNLSAVWEFSKVKGDFSKACVIIVGIDTEAFKILGAFQAFMDIGLVNRRDLDVFEGLEELVVFERAVGELFRGQRVVSIID